MYCASYPLCVCVLGRDLANSQNKSAFSQGCKAGKR